MKRLGNKNWKPEPVADIGPSSHDMTLGAPIVSLTDEESSQDRVGRGQRQSKSATRARWGAPSEIVQVAQ